MEISTKRVNMLIDGLNHRLTKVENDLKWIKWFAYYNATMMSAILVGLLTTL